MTIVVLGPSVVRAQGGSGSGSVSVSVPNLAPYVSPFIGLEATGGTVASCPSGQIMVGIAGTKIKLIKALTPLCGTFNKDGSFRVVTPLDPSAVGAGANGFRLQCSPAHTVTRVRVAFDRANTAQQYLGGVEIGCASWLISQWSGAPQPVATADFDTWAVRPTVACSNQTQPIRALQIRAVTAVKALSIVCDEI
ncbi:MAG TPA: hypothetical protein VJB15_11280 [Rhodothermia bacterium]|nr:hypothetical protein [Rhodothermia bacterium]